MASPQDAWACGFSARSYFQDISDIGRIENRSPPPFPSARQPSQGALTLCASPRTPALRKPLGKSHIELGFLETLLLIAVVAAVLEG